VRAGEAVFAGFQIFNQPYEKSNGAFPKIALIAWQANATRVCRGKKGFF